VVDGSGVGGREMIGRRFFFILMSIKIIFFFILWKEFFFLFLGERIFFIYV